MKRINWVFVLMVLMVFSCSSEKADWPDPTVEMKPWTRWWWLGNAVDQENIKRELNEMAEAGIGGVEITSIYGVRGEEHRFIEYLSPEFTEMVKFTIDEASKLGMGVSLVPGAGWRCGGPFVTAEKGLWALRMQSFEMKAGEIWQLPERIVHAEAASFLGEDGSVTVLQPEEKFTPPVNGTVYIAERVQTGDDVKRPSPGGEGLAIDTFNEEITNWYLEEFWNRLGISDAGIRCFFHDSFEYAGNFTPNFTHEFRKLRGYVMGEVLHVLAGDYHDEEVVDRVRSDYRETVSDLVLGSFMQPMKEWANSHQSLFRNQAHGSPGNILDIYAASDIPETEIFGRVEPGTTAVFVNKFASSAANVTGQRLVSSESFTWLDEHWTVTTSDMMRGTNRFFLAGVNHMFFHGTTYSPEDAEWPGWLFYASTQINNRNPLWREMPALFKYIERSQSILQNADQQNELLVYWPFYDVAAAELGGRRNYTNIDSGDNAGWFMEFPLSGLSESLKNSGYTFDYVSDKQLLNSKVSNGEIVAPGGATYKAVVVPATRFMPLETLQQLMEFIAHGGKVFFDTHLPRNVPGMYKLEMREEQMEAMKLAIDSDRWVGHVIDLLADASVHGERDLALKGFNHLQMEKNGEDWYMVFNCGIRKLDAWIELRSKARSYVLYFPETGEISLAANQGDSVRIQLEPERAVFIRCSRRHIDAPQFVYMDQQNESFEVKGLWNIEFIEGGPVYPESITTDRLDSWTRLGDDQTHRFSGTARYWITFDWDKKANSALINLGDVKDCAHVKLNGKAMGSLLGPTFKVKVDNLVEGENLLEVEVTNVAANRIRDYDIRGVDWKKFYDINFVNITYIPFDASGWEISESGLLGPVTIQPF
jgi:hypothetical protein